MESRVYLRALEPDDYKTSIKWRKDDEIWGMLGGAKYFVSEAYEKKWVEDSIFNSKEIKLAVCEKESNKYIGNVYATNIDLINRSCTSHVLIGEHELSIQHQEYGRLSKKVAISENKITEINEELSKDTAIVFSDEIVENICLKNWDLNTRQLISPLIGQKENG